MTDPSHDPSDSAQAPAQSTSIPNPFGYTILPPEFDLSHTRGQPILDNSLQSHLNSFFDSPDHSTAGLIHNSAMTDFMSQGIGDFIYDQSPAWYNEPAPNLSHSYSQRGNGNLSTMSDYPTRTQEDTDHPDTSTQPPAHQLLSGLGIDANAPEDVVQAAVKLYEYQSQSQRQAMLPISSRRPALTTNPSFTTPSAPASSSQRRASENAHISAMQYPHLRHSTDAVPTYSPPSSHHYPAPRHSYPTAQPYQFGSDADFNNNGYHGTYHTVAEQTHMDFIQNLTRLQSGAASAASSLPQSPIALRHDPHFHSHQAHSQSAIKQEVALDHSAAHYPVKRPRTTSSVVVKEDAQYASFPDASAPETRSSPEGDDSDSSGSSPESTDNNTPVNPRKRRKSSSAAQAKANAAARKNLTEEQKRENHIKSEQKRRNVIRDGYKNLNELVPNLRQGGFSKSATLTETVRELETLQAANAAVATQLMARTTWSRERLRAEMQSISGSMKTRP